MSKNKSVDTSTFLLKNICFSNSLHVSSQEVIINFSLFHRAFRFTKFYLYQRMHLFLSYTKIT